MYKYEGKEAAKASKPARDLFDWAEAGGHEGEDEDTPPEEET